MIEKSVLFISYDGMTDPLGQSQVLPYLAGLSQLGYRFTLLSCEKPDRYGQYKGIIEEITQVHNIDWQPISFTANPPVLAKYYDIYRLKRKAIALHRQKNFSLIHARSYVSAAIARDLKQSFGVKFLFDMRGFWVDERVDGGAWNLKNPFYKYAYRQYKKKEADYIAQADAIISLTEAGKREMQTWPSYKKAPIQVIPCSADFNLFNLVTPNQKAAARASLGIAADALVISYLGSVGAWYLLEEMLALFKQVQVPYPQAVFLFITPEPAEVILAPALQLGLNPADFVIRSATRKEVPFFTAASDINLFFIKQSYSKMASSPTKLGEILAMGLPVICNTQVGDVAEIVANTDSGLAISDFSPESFARVVDGIPALLEKDGATIRSRAIDYYTLENAVQKYVHVYQNLIPEKNKAVDVLTDAAGS
jgi:glycosyltransferase involved in cell wall biosynthesis